MRCPVLTERWGTVSPTDRLGAVRVESALVGYGGTIPGREAVRRQGRLCTKVGCGSPTSQCSCAVYQGSVLSWVMVVLCVSTESGSSGGEESRSMGRSLLTRSSTTSSSTADR
eukprot:1564940-Rhodomonas_salina.1